jgi:hypothetical protein
VVDPHLHEEAVALGLGQGVHALGFGGVLRAHHEERGGHRVGGPADRHLALGHDLEQRRLDLGRRPVDLVGQQQVDEHRAELDVERLGRRPVDASARDVGGQQVRGELHPGERPAHDGGQRLGGEGLRDAGRSFEKHVAAGEERDHQALDQAVLTDDDPAHLEQGVFEQRGVIGAGAGIGHARTVRASGRRQMGDAPVPDGAQTGDR